MADEELKLTVKLDDQASAALAALQAQMQQLSNVATQATTSFQNLPGAQQRQARASQQATRETAQEMQRMSYMIGFIGGAVGGAVSELTRMGMAFLARATDIKAYSQSLVDLSAKSYSMGTSTAQLKANLDSLIEAGVPKEEALRSLETFNERRGELFRQGSAATRELLQGDTTGELMELRNKIITQKEEDAYRTVVEFAKRQRELNLQRGMSGPEAAIEERKLLQRFAIDPRAVDAQFRQVSKAEEDFQNKRNADARRYTTAINQQEGSLGKILDTMMAITLAVGGVSEGVEGVTTWTNAVLLDLKGWETALRDTKDKSIAGLIQATIDWGRSTNTVVGAEISRFAADVQKITNDLHTAYQWAIDQGIIQVQAKPTPPPTPLAEQLDWEREHPGEEFPGPKPPPPEPKTFAGPVKVIPGGFAEKVLDFLFPQGFMPGGKIEPPKLYGGYATPQYVPPPPGPTQPGPTQPGPTTETAPATGGGILQFLRDIGGFGPSPTLPAYTPTPQQPTPQQFTSAATVGPTTGQFTPDPEFLAGHQSVMIEDRRAVEAQTTATKASTEEMQRLRDAFAAFEIPAPTVQQEAAPPPPMVVQQEAAPPPPMVVQQEATPPPNIGTILAAPEPIIVPTHELPPVVVEPAPAPQAQPAPAPAPAPQPTPFDERFGNWQQQQSQLPSAFEGGVPIDLAGTGNPQQAAGERGQTAGGWLAASMLDRSRDVNVNGTGSISVDVRAPAGTNVKAESGGIFRKTEISRQVQMEPAEFGLAPTMG